MKTLQGSRKLNALYGIVFNFFHEKERKFEKKHSFHLGFYLCERSVGNDRTSFWCLCGMTPCIVMGDGVGKHL